MGIAVRSGSPLSLRLAEPMWKLLAGSSLTISDIAEVDKDYMPGLLCIRNMEADPKSFAAMDMSFSTPSAAGHEVQLSARSVKLVSKECKILFLEESCIALYSTTHFWGCFYFKMFLGFFFHREILIAIFST